MRRTTRYPNAPIPRDVHHWRQWLTRFVLAPTRRALTVARTDQGVRALMQKHATGLVTEVEAGEAGASGWPSVGSGKVPASGGAMI